MSGTHKYFPNASHRRHCTASDRTFPPFLSSYLCNKKGWWISSSLLITSSWASHIGDRSWALLALALTQRPWHFVHNTGFDRLTRLLLSFTWKKSVAIFLKWFCTLALLLFSVPHSIISLSSRQDITKSNQFCRNPSSSVSSSKSWRNLWNSSVSEGDLNIVAKPLGGLEGRGASPRFEPFREFDPLVNFWMFLDSMSPIVRVAPKECSQSCGNHDAIINLITLGKVNNIWHFFWLRSRFMKPASNKSGATLFLEKLWLEISGD